MKINTNTIYIFILTSIIIFLPSMLMILFHQSSFTLGLVISSVIVILSKCLFGYTTTLINKNAVPFLLVIGFSFIFVFLHFIVIYYFPASKLAVPDVLKFSLSFFFIIICSMAAYIVKNVIIKNSDYELHTLLRMILCVIIFNALISLSKIDFFSTGLAKPTFFFLEPSHFALVCAPLLMYFSFTNIRSSTRILLLVFFGLWGFYIQNFTMLLAVALAYFITSKNMLLNFLILILVSIPVYLFIESDFFAYYRDRLDLAGDSQNLSSLVLLQGWENSFLTLQQSLIGVGFQQYGISTLYGDISEKIYVMLHMYINTFDAGSTAPKIIGEFGVFGIALIIMYIIGWLCIFLRIRSIRFTADKKSLLFSCLYLASFLEFFVRGAGYFTPSMFFFIVSAMYFLSNKKCNKENVL